MDPHPLIVNIRANKDHIRQSATITGLGGPPKVYKECTGMYGHA